MVCILVGSSWWILDCFNQFSVAGSCELASAVWRWTVRVGVNVGCPPFFFSVSVSVYVSVSVSVWADIAH